MSVIVPIGPPVPAVVSTQEIKHLRIIPTTTLYSDRCHPQLTTEETGDLERKSDPNFTKYHFTLHKRHMSCQSTLFSIILFGSHQPFWEVISALMSKQNVGRKIKLFLLFQGQKNIEAYKEITIGATT